MSKSTQMTPSRPPASSAVPPGATSANTRRILCSVRAHRMPHGSRRFYCTCLPEGKSYRATSGLPSRANQTWAIAPTVCPPLHDSPHTRDTFVLDGGLFDKRSRGGLIANANQHEPLATLQLGVPLPTQECIITFCL